jgi:hypothetical protein
MAVGPWIAASATGGPFASRGRADQPGSTVDPAGPRRIGEDPPPFGNILQALASESAFGQLKEIDPQFVS